MESGPDGTKVEMLSKNGCVGSDNAFDSETLRVKNTGAYIAAGCNFCCEFWSWYYMRFRLVYSRKERTDARHDRGQPIYVRIPPSLYEIILFYTINSAKIKEPVHVVTEAIPLFNVYSSI